MMYLGSATFALLTALALAPQPAPTFDGCTPGYWRNHPERWDGADGDDFTVSVKHHAAFNMFFGVTAAQSGLPDTATMLDAAWLGGGGLEALARHAAAAAADADSTINYMFTVQQVIDIYRDGVGADPGGLDVEGAKDILEEQNEMGCPLGNDDPDVTPYCFDDDVACPCGDFLGEGGCLHSGGEGALLSHSGTTSVAADDLVLTTSQLPLNSYSITFMGLQPGDSPFGNGRLCVSSPGAKLFRFKPAQDSGATGTMQLGPGIVAYSQFFASYGGNIVPGSTWYFQTYYRDVNSNCGSNFNLSNALCVEFMP